MNDVKVSEATTKDFFIGCRVDEKTKEEIEQTAGNNKRDLSDYLRLLLQYAIEKKLKF
jgi:antitoxin component of RelBE/YafQ-DinJ toxin-antitoxin module